MASGGFVGSGGGGFVESQHPRDAHGEFTGTGGSKHTGGFKPKAGAAGRGTPPKVTVDASPGTAAAAQQFFGRKVTEQDFQGLLGAPDGAHIAVDAGSGGNLIFHVTHPTYQQPHIAYAVKLPDGASFMQLELFHLKDSAPPGTGTKAFASMVENARKMGMEAIYIPTAARTSTGMVGYYVWPRLGADAKIPDELRSTLPATLATAERLSDLMQTREGAAWWKANGQTVACTFNLAPDSISSRVLDAYTSKAKETVH